MALTSFGKNVAASGTAERLNSSDQLVRSVVIRSKPGNTGNVYVGDAGVSSTDPGLAVGETLQIKGDPFLNLFDIFVDADQNGDGVDLWLVAYAS